MTERDIGPADEVVTQYAFTKLGEAVKEVEQKRNGIGCDCSSCKKGAVSEVNSWLDFCEGDIDTHDLRYGIDCEGKIYVGYPDGQEDCGKINS